MPYFVRKVVNESATTNVEYPSRIENDNRKKRSLADAFNESPADHLLDTRKKPSNQITSNSKSAETLDPSLTVDQFSAADGAYSDFNFPTNDHKDNDDDINFGQQQRFLHEAKGMSSEIIFIRNQEEEDHSDDEPYVGMHIDFRDQDFIWSSASVVAIHNPPMAHSNATLPTHTSQPTASASLAVTVRYDGTSNG